MVPAAQADPPRAREHGRALRPAWPPRVSSRPRCKAHGGAPETPDRSCPGLACLLCFLVATCFTLRSGSYWLEIFDQYAAALNLILLAFFEVVGVVYVYGMKR